MRRPAPALVMLLAVLVTTACAGDRTTPATAAPTGSPPASVSTYGPYGTAIVAPYDPAHPRLFPADAELATPYPVDLVAHCPIDPIYLLGAYWSAERPTDPQEWQALAQTLGEIAPPNGVWPGVVTGTLELLDADTARLVIDQRYWPSAVEVVIYHRGDASGGCL